MYPLSISGLPIEATLHSPNDGRALAVLCARALGSIDLRLCPSVRLCLLVRCGDGVDL